MSKITPCLWFDGDAEEAARFWCGLLPNSRITHIGHAPGDNPGTAEGPHWLVATSRQERPVACPSRTSLTPLRSGCDAHCQ